MSQATTLTALRERIRQIEQPIRHGVLPFGADAIDGVLPGGGLALGAVHEILAAGGDEEDSAVAAAFAAGILARIGTLTAPTSLSERRKLTVPRPLEGRGGDPPRQRWGGEVGVATGKILWCLKRSDLYGPGLRAHGLDPARLVLVMARRDSELLWAIEEALSAGPGAGIAAVVGEIGRLPMVAGRRLQLAAERSGITALLLRRWRTAAEADAERERPTAALTRWRIAALPSQNTQQHFPGEGRGPSGRLGVAEKWAPAFAGEDVSGRRSGKEVGRPRWRVELLRCRGGRPSSWEVEGANAAGHVSLSAGLADRQAAPPEPQTAIAQVDSETGPLRLAG